MKEETNASARSLDSLDYLFGFYVLISLVIAGLASQYEMMSALIVAPNLFLIPYLVGAGIVCIFSRIFNHMSRSLKFLVGFFVGAIFLHSLVVLADFLGYRIDMTILDIVIVATIDFGFIRDALRRKNLEKRMNHDERAEQTRRALLPLALCALVVCAIAVLAFCVPKIKVPFPLISYDHAVGQETIRPVTRLLNEGFLDVASARAIPVILQTVVCSLSTVPISNLSWAAPLSTSLVFSVSVFSLAYHITKKRTVAIASVLFAVFLFSGGSDLFFDCVYYIYRYSTIQTAVLPLAIQVVYSHFSEVKDEKKRKPLVLLFMGTVLFVSIFYAYEFLQPPYLTSIFSENEYLRPPLIMIFLILVLMISKRIENHALKELVFFISLFAAFSLSLDIFRPVLAVMFLFFFLLLLTQAYTKVTESSHLTVAWFKTRPITLSWSRKLVFLRIFAFIMLLWIVICIAGYVNLSDFSPLLGVWGMYTLTKLQSLIAANSVEVMAIFLAVSVPLIFSMNLGEFALTFVSLAGLSAYFLPLTELFYVVYNISNITVGFAIATGLFKFADQLSQLTSARIKTPKIKLRISGQSFKTALGLLLCMIVVVPVIEASLTKFTWTGGADYRSILTSYEEKAIEECISKLPQDVRIISDPFTMIVLSSLTNRVGLVEHGIAPLTEQYKSADTVSTIWKDVFNGNSSLEIHQSIVELRNTIPPDEALYVQRTSGLNLSRFAVIVSGRTSWWLDQKDPLGYYTVFPWSYRASSSHIIHFLDPFYFNLKYAIDEKIYIFIS